MSSELAIEAQGLGKRFALFDRPSDRLKQLLWGRWHSYGREFWALQDVNFEIPRGAVVGLVGRNGAGKSTLLQMVCGTLTPTAGTLAVRGRVAALLELGAGFNPDFSGIENVYMNAAILGLTRAQVDERLDAILAFADIGRFAQQPVKTYSSGMFVRLAFAVATSVEPDILVIDEALSVGDGAFARKSFDRIMALREGGATILFCSHAMYHVQALCSKALWLEGGRVRMWDEAAKVTTAYETALVMDSQPAPPQLRAPTPVAEPSTSVPDGATALAQAPQGSARIVRIEAFADGVAGLELAVQSGQTDVEIHIHFSSDPALPCPTAAMGLQHISGVVVSSAVSALSGNSFERAADGSGVAVLRMPSLPLLQGDYSVTAILACERGLHPYEIVERAVLLRVVQSHLLKGLTMLPHTWTSAQPAQQPPFTFSPSKEVLP